MEVSGVAFRSLSCFSGTVSSRKSSSVSGFSDHGHLQCYVLPRCDAIKKKEKKKDLEMVTIKKKSKFMKVLSKDLSMLSSWGFGVETEGGLIDEYKGRRISEAAELLLEQLKQLRTEEKEMKRKRKEEKAQLKAAAATQMGSTAVPNCSDCIEIEKKEIVNILRSGVVGETEVCEPQLSFPAEAKSKRSANFIMQEQNKMLMGGRIEVCMGGKCKKAGAMELLEEFERRVGVEGTVVGCKCMGKCRDGPNVRVLNHHNNSNLSMNSSVAPSKKPICIGVGLEDVGLIAANFLEKEKDLGLMAA